MKTHFGLIGTTLSLISLNRPQLQAQAVGISSVAAYAEVFLVGGLAVFGWRRRRPQRA